MEPNVLNGIAISSGVAIGRVHLLDRSKLCILKHRLEDDAIESEVTRFREGIQKTKVQMQEIKKRAQKVADKYAVILDTYTLLLEDEILVSDTIENIRRDNQNAEYALTQTLEKFTHLFSNISDEYLQGKKDDLDLVVHAVIRNLTGHTQETLSEILEPVIVVTHQLSPSDTLTMPKHLVLGLATEVGGKTSHVGIFASALGIPAVGGMPDLTSRVNSGDTLVVDGIDGQVIVNPSANRLRHYRRKQQNYHAYQEKLLEDIHKPAVTLDGHAVKLMANIESADEVPTLNKYGAEGVGLYRTEFLYMGTSKLPEEADLYENFKKVAKGLEPRPLVIRTLDIGMDKHFLHDEGNDEENPALGLRGIRLSLVQPELFLSQIRAILRASLYGDVRILLPMISAIEEVDEALALLDQAKRELKANEIPFNEDIEVGAMVETPAAALIIDRLLERVDFISIGTNDLIQYLLAVDRTNGNVAHLYQPFHPAVLRALSDVFTAAQKAGKPVSICGELGGDPLATLLIMGLGPIQELSMEPHAIPKVKKVLRKTRLKEARKLAAKALGLATTQEINQFINEEMRTRFPSDFDRDLSFEEKKLAEPSAT